MNLKFALALIALSVGAQAYADEYLYRIAVPGMTSSASSSQVEIVEDFSGVTPNTNPALSAESIMCGIGAGPAIVSEAYLNNVNITRTCSGVNRAIDYVVVTVPANATGAILEYDLTISDMDHLANATLGYFTPGYGTQDSSPTPTNLAISYGVPMRQQVVLQGTGTFQFGSIVTRPVSMTPLSVKLDNLKLTYTP